MDQEAKAKENVTFTLRGDDALICSLKSMEEFWALGSRASFHANSKKEFFERYFLRNLGKEYLGDDQNFVIASKD